MLRFKIFRLGLYWKSVSGYLLSWNILNMFKFFDTGKLNVSCLHMYNVPLLNSRHEGNLKIDRLVNIAENS